MKSLFAGLKNRGWMDSWNCWGYMATVLEKRRFSAPRVRMLKS